MNIQTAALYAKHGYRIRRAAWQPGELIGKMDDRWFFHHSFITNSEGLALPISASWVPSNADLVADDWELILDGISKNFGDVEYEDKT